MPQQPPIERPRRLSDGRRVCLPLPPEAPVVANLYGTIEGAKTTKSATGTDLLRARLATWHGAVVVTLDDFGSWTVHAEPADPQEAAGIVPAVLAAGNLHTTSSTYQPGSIVEYNERAGTRTANRSPARRPSADWRPYREEHNDR